MTDLVDAGRMLPIDPRRWPDVVRVPGGGIRPFVARRLFHAAVGRLTLRVQLPDGRMLGRGGPQSPRMDLLRPDSFYRRVGADGLIGFGEAYLAGDWATDDLPGLLTVFAGQVPHLVPRALQTLRGAVLPRQPAAERNTEAGSRQNIRRHYDLSNDLFELFLDRTMTYSSALFDTTADGIPVADHDRLARAQHRKIDRLLDGTGVGPGTRLLEIGTGWGELAIRAARRGATVRSLTLSTEQADLARRRAAQAGVADAIKIDLMDYRAASGEYDAVVSVEMIEAVGDEFWPAYFSCVDRLLRPGGLFGLQAITMPHERMLATRRTYTWIHKYVFPGGLIPSVRAIESTVAEHTALRVVDDLAFGAHYAQTLRLWRETFTGRLDELAPLGFDAAFARMWEFYLAYSEAGFRAGYLDVHQLLLRKSA